MLPDRLCNNHFFSFLSDHIDSDPSVLLMKYAGKELDFDLNFAVVQIANRKKTKRKLPLFLSHEKFLFPDLISSEQATDERVARFHASLIGSDKRVFDLTAGLGIDAMFAALFGNEVIAIEIDPLKADTLAHNSEILEITNLSVVNDDCENFLKMSMGKVKDSDIFFIDPARRDDMKRRTYAFSDCTPDITSFYEQIVGNGATLIIKSSPLLDICAIKKQFKYIQQIYAISVKGECKELLVVLKKENKHHFELVAVDLDDNGVASSFSINDEGCKSEEVIADISDIEEEQYIYEPNASLMKLNAGGEICKCFAGIKKIAKNTELFVSPNKYEDFPGRIIKITRKLSSRDLKALKGKEYSVAVRNYPLKAEQLKKKIGVGESRDYFIYGFRAGKSEQPMLIEGKRE